MTGRYRYWSLAHLALFSIPIWWVQPIADNVTTMIFNVYQSFLSHQSLESAGSTRDSDSREDTTLQGARVFE